MADPALKLMTADEFVLWDDGTDTRYELIDGIVTAMASPSANHGTIVANAGRLIGNLLERRPPCRAIVEAGLAISAHRFFVADVVATCTPPAGGPSVADPFLVIEVLSPSTRKDDMGLKLPDYRQLASVAEIWLIDGERRHVQLWRRDPAVASRWIVEDLVGAATFTSTTLDDRVALDALYRNTTL
jgi:Uma2 family endonuclease